ncbi:helix-turn-helix domain-containing protein [Bosea sp. BH3]|uniref:helix-turn-helix domain-containing protein n=1 Tax=Bosea sp. BH3 TaxID=2871701 RepID=UPI0021CB4E3E|nr:helix-turn-helix domain-containing protein [Bosea sp. BH3]MCU4181771.1 helix-turn-helix domain-containing protein [Bosea sp. BH3]
MDPSTIPSSEFSTRQFDIWRDSIAVVFDVERQASEADSAFIADVEAFQLGDMVVTAATLGEQRYTRSQARLRRDGMDHFVLNLYRTGGWRAQTPNGDFQGVAGQVSVLDLASELISDEPHSELVTLFLPRSLLEERLPNLGALHGSGPTGPHAALLAEYIDLLARRLPTLPAGEEQALSRATCEMLTACISPTLANVEAARPGLEMVLQRRARRFIEGQLNSPDLTADAICGAVGVSRRTLYRLFEQDGGVQRYIQARRLVRIKALLADASDGRRISEIAAEFGFTRPDHFARAFKHQFGQSARDLREFRRRHLGTGVVLGAKRNDIGSFDTWIRALHDRAIAI